jgi:hypothetical protein
MLYFGTSAVVSLKALARFPVHVSMTLELCADLGTLKYSIRWGGWDNIYNPTLPKPLFTDFWF